MVLKPAFALTLACSAALTCITAHATDLVVATVNNGHMIEMQKHTADFEKANPGIHLKWVTLEEATLRSRVTTDIATKGGGHLGQVLCGRLHRTLCSWQPGIDRPQPAAQLDQH